MHGATMARFHCSGIAPDGRSIISHATPGSRPYVHPPMMMSRPQAAPIEACAHAAAHITI
jgi:hypothetical protein